VLLLTPTGSLPSPGWRWWARAAVVVPVVSLLMIVLAPRSFDPGSRTPDNPFDLTGLGGALLVVYQLTFAITNLAVVVGAGSLVVRFRRARGTERQQLQWVALAAALTVLGSLVVLAAVAVGASPELLGGWRASTWPSCRWRSAPQTFATGCTTLTGSSAGPWPTGC
jgi:hypothetical protein